MKKIICFSKGNNLLLDEPLYERYQEQYEFIDGNLQYATAIIKNKKGQMFIVYNKKHQSWQLPAGKIDKGESVENGLKREMNEELGINIEDIKYLGNIKVVLNGISWQGYHYEILKYQGKIYNKEPDIHNDGIRIDIIKSDNLLGFNIKIGNKIIDNIDVIMDERKNIIWYQNFILDSKFNNIRQNFKINLSKIEKDKEYVQYFDTDNQEYGILPKKSVF